MQGWSPKLHGGGAHLCTIPKTTKPQTSGGHGLGEGGECGPSGRARGSSNLYK